MLTKLTKNLRQKTMQQKMGKKIMPVPKKAIIFVFINVYKFSPNFAGAKSRWSRPNSETYLDENHWNSLRCAALPDFWRFQEKLPVFEQKAAKSEFIFLEKYMNQIKNFGHRRIPRPISFVKIISLFPQKRVLVLTLK